jgi:glycerophosphoryl diester phosphodiesterase
MPPRPFLDHPAPFGIAHRGGADDFPENTIPAFDAAVALGYRHLETDAHVSGDGVVFAFHDRVLDRLTNAHGRLSAVSSSVIASADAAYNFNPSGGYPLRGTGIRIPTMEQVLIRWPGVFVNIDAKSDAVVGPLVELLRRVGALDRVCVASFRDERIRRVRTLSGGAICTSMGPRAISRAWLASRAGRMPRLGADCVQVPARTRAIRIVDRRFVARAHATGLQVHVWTIDAEDDMTALLDLGVDAIMTDRPRLLRDVLTARGTWHGGSGEAA